MEGETIKRIADFFEPGELAEYLGLSVEDLIEAFPQRFEDALDEIEELMQVKHG